MYYWYLLQRYISFKLAALERQTAVEGKSISIENPDTLINAYYEEKKRLDVNKGVDQHYFDCVN